MIAYFHIGMKKINVSNIRLYFKYLRFFCCLIPICLQQYSTIMKKKQKVKKRNKFPGYIFFSQVPITDQTLSFDINLESM